jgi:hypothetical protein
MWHCWIVITTTLWNDNVPMSRDCGIAMLEYFKMTVLQGYEITIWQYDNVAMLQCYKHTSHPNDVLWHCQARAFAIWSNWCARNRLQQCSNSGNAFMQLAPDIVGGNALRCILFRLLRVDNYGQTRSSASHLVQLPLATSTDKMTMLKNTQCYYNEGSIATWGSTGHGQVDDWKASIPK